MGFLKVWCRKKETANMTKKVPTNPLCANTLRHKIYLINMQTFSSFFSIVKLKRCTIFEFIEYHSRRFGRSFHPPSGVQEYTHSIRYMSYRLVDCLLSSSRRPERPSETCRVIVKKLENCASSWFYYRNKSGWTVPWTSNSFSSYLQKYRLRHHYNEE
jgi:hypothetical protein